MNIGKSILLAALAIACSGIQLSAQDYEDDIYYDASKAKNKTKTPVVKQPAAGSVASASRTATEYYDYPAADTYSTHGVTLRDVDEYNRRGYYAVTDTVPVDTVSGNSDDFEYTRRIERFYNPSVVAASGDAQLKEYYYDSEPQTEVNIVVGTPGYWGCYPYGGWSVTWSSSPWYWSSWYSPYYGYYDPYWAWNGWWGPTWYYPYHHHHYHPAPLPAGHWQPSPVRHGRYNGPGRNGVTPGRNAYRPGRSGHQSVSGARPGGTSGYKPGARPSTTRQGSSVSNSDNRRQSSGNNGNYRPSNSGNDNRSSYSRPSGGSGSRGGFSGGSRSGGGSRGGGGGRGGRH